MNCMGLDLSLTGTGLVVVSSGGVIHYELITTSKQSYPHDGERLLYIKKRIMKQARFYRPVLTCIEGAAMSGKEKRIYELAGTVKTFLVKQQLPYEIVHIGTLKKLATGYGRASKDEMVKAAQEFCPEVEDDNIADAIHLAREAFRRTCLSTQ